MSHRSRRAYDHRIKEQIIRAGDPELFPELEIPRSTAVSWIRRGVGEIVSLVQADGGEPALRERIAKLEGRVAMLTAQYGPRFHPERNLGPPNPTSGVSA